MRHPVGRKYRIPPAPLRLTQGVRNAPNHRAFTLIELLIVIAIIAILALIAVPNFLEAQTRAKVTTAFADIRSHLTAMEAYRIDYGRYIPDTGGRREDQDWARLTTPVAYMTSIFYSPFRSNDENHYGDKDKEPYWYADTSGNARLTNLGLWLIMGCAGPDMDEDWGDLMNGTDAWVSLEQKKGKWELIYAPSNGTVSSGDIIATNKGLYNR